MMSSGKLDKPSFAYENGILEKWREAGVKTPEDVDVLKDNRKKNAKPASNAKETSFDLDEFFAAATLRGEDSEGGAL